MGRVIEQAKKYFMKSLSNPFIQVFSFCIILISGDSFGGPYAIYVYHASLLGIPYGIAGVMGIALTLLSLIKKLSWLQVLGLLSMVVSLVLFFSKGYSNVSGTFKEVLPLLTLGLFALICVMVVKRYIQWKNS
jgi:hypothetical protein